MKKIKLVWGLCLLSIVFVGCNINPKVDDPAVNNSPVGLLTGSFIDSPVKGLKFVTTSGIEGITDKNGNFTYNTGDEITFYIGEHTLGQGVTGSKTITPLEICDATNIETSTKATNLVRLLLALDTGDNAYGLTLPDNIDELINTEFNLNEILEMVDNNFETAITAVVADIKEVAIAEVVIPTYTDAIEHFEVSLELVDIINASDSSNNMFITVKVPEGRTGRVSVAYIVGTLIEGVTSYPSGTSSMIDISSSTVSLQCEIYETDYFLTLTQFSDSSKVQIGDIFCFYTEDGFKPTPESGFPLLVGSEQINLQSDLTTQGGIIESVHTTSGFIEVPQFLPNGIDFINAYSENSFMVFIDVKDINDDTVGSFSVIPVLEATTEWKPAGEKYKIKFSTSLPANLKMSSQIYLSSNEIETSEVYDLVAWHYFDGGLTSNATDYNFTGGTWDLID